MDILATILSGIAENQIWFFAGLLFLVILIIAVIAVILMRGGSRSAEAPPPPPATEVAAAEEPVPVATDVSARDIRRQFREGMKAYRETLSRNVYLVPWYLRVGTVASNDGGLLSCAEEVRPPVVAQDRPAGFSWRFYDRAVVLDVEDPQAAWGGVLDQLGRHRAMLPADGLILTVPLEELDDVRRAAARGAELYARLWELQRTLGFALPVYVVVTGCERIAGFDTLAELLPDALKDGMLGWSSPYALETAFSPEFVGQALQSVADGLLAVELEIFGSGVGEDGGPLFALTEGLAGTDAALRALLGTAFKRTAYQETLYVRGLYFTGRLTAETPAVFGRDLLSRKIFLESGLPKPTRALAASRAWRRYVWPVGTGVTAIAALLLLWSGVRGASTLSERMIPILADIPANLQETADRRAAFQNGTPLPATHTDPAARFVHGVATLPYSWDVNPLPASWFSSVSDDVRRALAVGYRRLALASVRDVAESRLRRLGEETTRGTAGGSDFERMRAFAAEIAMAEGLARAYNGVDFRDPNMPLDEVLDFAFGSGVGRGFSARLHGWGVDLPPQGGSIPVPGPGTQRPIDLAAYRGEVNRRFRQYADGYIRELAMGGLTTARLAVAAKELDLLAGGVRTGADGATAYAEVLSGLDAAAQGLSAERGAWIAADGPVLPKAFDALLTQLDKSELLGPNLRDEIMTLAQRRYDEAGAATRSMESVIGRLLVQGPNGEARLSPAAEQLRQTLSVWMSRRFMRPVEAAGSAVPAVGAGWDRASLETIPPLVEDYLLFDAKDLPQVPQPLRASMRGAAQYQLRVGVEQILARALTGSPGGGVDRVGGLSQLRESARVLRMAFPVLAETMQSFRQIGLSASADVIRDILSRQANDVLMQADRLLEGDQLYRPDARGLDMWVTGPLTPYSLFGQANPGGLALYLGNARQEVGTLARDIAAPVVEILERPVMGRGAASGMASKWSRIIAELDKYDGGRPNSSLAQLEKFVTIEAAAIDATSCEGLAAYQGGMDAGDFFQGRLVELKQWIVERCRLAIDARLYDAYVEVANLFNQTLAGRFPFASASASAASAADAEGVRLFYETFDRQSDILLNGFRRDSRFVASAQEAKAFVSMMALARPALMAAVTPGESGGISLDPVFRTNRNNELGGRNIIEWRLETPNGAISSILPRKPLRWYPGDPVTVTLRWAKDGTLVPVAAIGGGNSTIDGPALRYDFTGSWALFSLARQHEAAQRNQRTSRDTETLLQFEALTDAVKTETGKAEPGEKGTAAAAPDKPVAPLALVPIPLQPGQSQPVPKANLRVFLDLGAKRTVLAEGKPPKDEKITVPVLPVQAPPVPPVGSIQRNGTAGWGAARPFQPATLPPGRFSGVGGVAPADRAFFDLDEAAPVARPAAQRMNRPEL